MKKITVSALLFAFLFAGCSNAKQNEASKKEVVLYSSRHYDSDQKLYEEFTKKTGIEVKVKKADAKALLEEIESAKGNEAVADLFYTADAGKLAEAANKGVFEKFSSKVVEENIPANYRDKDNMWTGLTMRARIIAYAKDRVTKEMLSTYEDLADAKWNKKITTRPSSHVYNQSLLASFIAINGEEKAKDWAKGLVNNFARTPKGNDRDQVKAVAANEADIAIVNSYYIGIMMNSNDEKEKEAVSKVEVFFPNQETTGTHVNVSGAGVIKNAKNKENAIQLLEFLSSKEAQEIFAARNYEFPVNPKAEVKGELLSKWRDFKKQDLPLSALGVNNKKAREIMDQVGW